MKQLKKFLWDSGFKCKKKMSDSSRVFRHYIRPVGTKEEVILILYKYKKMEDRNCCTYIEIIWVEIGVIDIELNKTFEEELVSDIVSLMASFSARLYDKRSSRNRK